MFAIVFYHMVFTLYLYGIRQHDSIKFLFSNANMHIAKVGVTGHLSLPHPFAERHLKPYSFLFTLFGMDSYVDSFGIPSCSLGIGEWFLGCLIMMYVLFPLLRILIIKRPYMTFAIATLYYALMIDKYYDFKLLSTVPMFTNFTIKIYDFILGMFIARILVRIPPKAAIIGLIVNLHIL